MTTVHRPVMAAECLKAMELRCGDTAIDGTTGGGGHTARIAKAVSPSGLVVAIDRDPTMLTRAQAACHNVAEMITFHAASYADAETILAQLGLPAVDAILVDLGLSSDQLADRERGFGIQTGGPLDLRFDPSTGRPASAWLAESDEDKITAAFSNYADLASKNPIVQAILRNRRQLNTAEALAELVLSAAGGRGKTHPATVVFQALRIAVNDELLHVERAVNEVFPACLKPGGRLAVLSFHSIEDRIVKQAFQKKEVWTCRQKKPILPRPAEVRNNPRSRSAKLRVAIRNP